MSIPALVPEMPAPSAPATSRRQPRLNPRSSIPLSPTYSAQAASEPCNCQAELFYLQKQIHAQTPMVIVLEDGERIEGRIEWYDRNSLKVVARQRTLIYKAAIKYMFKQSDLQKQGPGNSSRA